MCGRNAKSQPNDNVLECAFNFPFRFWDLTEFISWKSWPLLNEPSNQPQKYHLKNTSYIKLCVLKNVHLRRSRDSNGS